MPEGKYTAIGCQDIRRWVATAEIVYFSGCCRFEGKAYNFVHRKRKGYNNQNQ